MVPLVSEVGGEHQYSMTMLKALAEMQDELPPLVLFATDPFAHALDEFRLDFRIEGRTLVFERQLKTEGRLGFWRWLSMWVGVAGTYRQNDSVDVVYERGGQRVVATRLPLEPVG